jgi:hypothetical protein
VVRDRDEERKVEVSSTVTDAQRILIYPNAQNIKETDFDPKLPWRHIIEYDVFSVGMQDVLKFYKEQLANTGWTLDHNGGIYGLPATEYAGFHWSDPAGVVPYDLTFDVRVAGNDRTSGASTWLDRKPDADRVPLYPDAQQVDRYIKLMEGYKGSYYHQQFTSYLSNAAPSAIEEYYKTIMAQGGWRLSDDYNAGISGGMPGFLFSYVLGNTDNTWVGNVSVLITKDVSGLTKVEIRAEGDDIDPPPPRTGPPMP